MPPHRFPASLAPLLPLGRWSPTPTNGLAASWPGSSLTLRFTGSYLALDGGRETARLGRPGGEEKTLTWTVFCPGRGELEGAPAPGNTGTVRTANLRNGERVVLWDQPGEGEERVCRVYIGDWGSVVEVAAFFADEETSLLPPSPAPQTRILTIGDSISCAYSMGSEWGQKVPPHGAWDAWPLLAGRIISARALAQGQGQGQGEGQLGTGDTPALAAGVGVETVAYPGVTLVDTYTSGAGGKGDGMVSRFWQKSWFSHDPWDPSPAHSPLYIPPTVVIIALGANDDGWGVPVFHFTSSLRGLVERLVEAFRRSLEDVVLLTPFYSMGAGHSRFAAATASLVSDLRAEWHPSPSPSSSSSSDEQHMPRIHSISTQGWLTPALAPDGIHPSVEGNEVMARRLVEAWERGWEDGG